jgi:integrase/recombinase XerD
MHTPTDQSIRKTASEYLIHLKAAGRSPATIESYETSLDLLARHLDRRGALETSTASVLDAAVAGMSGAGKPGGPQRSEPTLNRYRATYRGFFRWAFEAGRITRNPAALLRLARVDSPPTSPITPAETKLLLMSGVNYFFALTTIISPDQRQLLFDS